MSFQHNYFQYYFLKTSSILNSGYFWELPIAFPPTMSRKYRQLGEKFRMVCLFPSAWVVLVLVSTGNLLQESKRTPHDFLLQVRSVCMSQRAQGCCPHWVGGGVGITHAALQGGGDEDGSFLISLKTAFLVCDICLIAARGCKRTQTQRSVCFVRRLNQHCVTPLASCHLSHTACFYVFMVRL